MSYDIHWVDQCGSTNASCPVDAPHGYTLAARAQSHGRGQRGSSWESAPGLNLTFSEVLRPIGLHATCQMAVCMVASLAVCLVAQPLLQPYGIGVSIKWPNDIYVDGDRKLAGLLIENTLQSGWLTRSIVGVGLNVNQRQWLSDAPNPVSLSQLTGRVFDLDSLLRDIAGRLAATPLNDNVLPSLRRHYLDHLWRREGWHRWRQASDGADFMARIHDVGPDGRLYLHDAMGSERVFAFKEVRPVLGREGWVSPTDL